MKPILLFVFILSHILLSQSDDKNEIVDLRGQWKFEIGDNEQYAKPNFNDSGWEEIFVPADWENEGFAGYNGYAWYRKKFVLPSSASNKKLYFRAGYVDDVCAVYVNGNCIGVGGSFPPDYETAYNQEHIFLIPQNFLYVNKENTIAVRVFDEHLNGGMVKGRVGIVSRSEELPFVVTFPEQWKFATGDNDEWKSPSYNDRSWKELIVPAKWDFQGFKNYDGFAWYRVSFTIPSSFKNESLVLVLGKIDDVDETFLNGEKIGSTGNFRSTGNVRNIQDEYLDHRVYEIPSSQLKIGERNVLAVRVYDNFKDGGIYEGPIGIIQKKDLNKLQRTVNRPQNIIESPFDKLLKILFDEK